MARRVAASAVAGDDARRAILPRAFGGRAAAWSVRELVADVLDGIDGGAGGSVAAAPGRGPGTVTVDIDGRTSDGTRLTGRLVCRAS